MRKRNFFIVVIIVLCTFTFCSCKKNEMQVPKLNNTFDIVAASNIMDSYMKYLMKGDFESVKKICSSNIVKEQTSRLNKSDLSIKSYKIEEVTELGKFANFKIRVMSIGESKPYTLLEEYSVNVIKEKDGYKISEIKTSIQKEAFVEYDEIRIRDKNNVETKLVLSIQDIPKYIFPQDDSLNTYKQIIPMKKFGKISLSFDGMKLTVSTTDNKRSYAGMVKIDETLAVQGKESEGGEGEGASKVPMKGIREKPIGKEITGLDLIEGCYVNYMVFSQDEKFIVMQYTKDDNTKCIRVYQTNDGKLIPVKFEKSYPLDKVNVVLLSCDEDVMNFEVVPKGNMNGENKDLIGKWQMNFETFKIKKI
ncbi:hypothetical protein ACFIJ5_01375 [Haloimpatiens sp. FM7330]|uniref:hypothetical protein n=1 Tax=Haloimpatiens sp. FM7330 TaxID=3298610 RepID=UPI00363A00B4